MTDRELMDMAREAAGKAYVPYSQFPVGAALECSDGTVFTGCNVENAALGSTICAERTAACKAVSEGHQDGGALRQGGGPLCELQAQPAPASHLQLLTWSLNSSGYSALPQKGGASPAPRPRSI